MSQETPDQNIKVFWINEPRFNRHHIAMLKKLGFSDEDIRHFESRVIPAIEFHISSNPSKEDLIDHEFTPFKESLNSTIKSVNKLLTSNEEKSTASSSLYERILLEELGIKGDGKLLEKYLLLATRLRFILEKRVEPKLPTNQTRQHTASPYLIEILHNGLTHIGKIYPPSTGQSKDNKFYQVACICWDAMGRGEPEAAVKAYIKQIKSMT